MDSASAAPCVVQGQSPVGGFAETIGLRSKDLQLPASGSARSDADHKAWRDRLHLLDGLGLVLLPIGAGTDRKAPVDPHTGRCPLDWQNLPGNTAAEIAAMDPRHVIGAGIHTGPSGLDVLDLDGAAAVAWVAAHGVDPRDPALFRITRTTDPDRFKIPFRLTTEQRERLPQSKLLLRVGEPDAEGKRQALELYGNTGAQVVALGFHAKSGGWYDWAGDPSMIGPPSEAWMQVLIALHQEVERLRGLGDTSRPPRARSGKSGGRWLGSSRRHPCPVCGRDHSAACTRTTSADGRELVSCFHGGSFFPPEGLKAGDVVTGRDGGRWAFLETYVAECLGDKSLFINHVPKEVQRLEGAQLAPRQAPEAGQQPDPAASTSSPAGKAPAEEEPRRLSELLELALQALRTGDTDGEAELRAEIMARFKRTDSQVTAALFRLLTDQEVGAAIAQPRRGVDLMQVDSMRWLLPGFIPEKDQTLLYGAAGSGKTTAALRMAFEALDGRGFLGEAAPAGRVRRVLFIASDSGPEPLRQALEDANLLHHPAVADGRFTVWAHSQEQGQTAWDASLPNCLQLLEELRRDPCDLVMIDSAKAVTSRADLNYLDNSQTTALLTFFKNVICRHAAALWLHHDGTEKGACAGAKAWREIPSAVHRIDQPVELVDADGSGTAPTTRAKADVRVWQVVKTRKGTTKTITYRRGEGGQLLADGQAQAVGSCPEAVLTVLRHHASKGGRSMATAELIAEVRRRWQYSRKRVENTLAELTQGKAPELVRPTYGRYALAPRLMEQLEDDPPYMSPLQRGGSAENSVSERDYKTPVRPPAGDFTPPNPPGTPPAGDSRGTADPNQQAGSQQNPPEGGGIPIGAPSTRAWLEAIDTPEPAETWRQSGAVRELDGGLYVPLTSSTGQVALRPLDAADLATFGLALEQIETQVLAA